METSDEYKSAMLDLKLTTEQTIEDIEWKYKQSQLRWKVIDHLMKARFLYKTSRKSLSKDFNFNEELIKIVYD